MCRGYLRPASPWPRWRWLQWCRPCHAAPPGWTRSGPASWTPRLQRTKGRQRRMTALAGFTTLFVPVPHASVPKRHMENSRDTGSLGSETKLTCPNSTSWDYPTAESTELPAALRTGTELSLDTSSPRVSPRLDESLCWAHVLRKGACVAGKQNRLWSVTLLCCTSWPLSPISNNMKRTCVIFLIKGKVSLFTSFVTGKFSWNIRQQVKAFVWKVAQTCCISNSNSLESFYEQFWATPVKRCDFLHSTKGSVKRNTGLDSLLGLLGPTIPRLHRAHLHRPDTCCCLSLCTQPQGETAGTQLLSLPWSCSILTPTLKHLPGLSLCSPLQALSSFSGIITCIF